MRIESVPLSKIMCESNRTTKDEAFDQLMNNINQYGIIQMPSLRQMDDDQFKIVVGRRRIEAARRLKLTAIDCIIREADDPVDLDEEVALSENVNRLEMHPLDEAGAFNRMFNTGTPIEEIARYYARSPSAIYKRLRLCRLVEELKEHVRNERLSISGAAVLAELPDEDQYEFYELYKDSTNLDDFVTTFYNKKQRFVINRCMAECEGCNKRTHNTGNELFEEYDSLNDVCLDADCYRLKWYNMITAKLNEQKIQFKEAGVHTDNKIFFEQGVPALLYKKAAYLNIGKEEKYEILRDKDYDFTIDETNRKKDTCWKIGSDHEGLIYIKRIGYKEKPPREKKSSSSESLNKNEKFVKDTGHDILEAIATEHNKKPIEIAKILEKTYIYPRHFKNDIKDIICNQVIAKRIKMETDVEPPRNYLQMYIRILGDEYYGKNKLLIENFDTERKKWFNDLFGNTNYAKISVGLSYEAQRLFHFLILCEGFGSAIPDLDDLKDIEKQDNQFWQYAAMTKDEYRAMYLEAAREVAAKALPKEKSKKKATSPHGEEGKETASGDSSASSSNKKVKPIKIIDEKFNSRLFIKIKFFKNDNVFTFDTVSAIGNGGIAHPPKEQYDSLELAEQAAYRNIINYYKKPEQIKLMEKFPFIRRMESKHENTISHMDFE